MVKKFSQLPLQSVLIIGPSWIGDMVMAQTLFKLLRHTHPELAIDVLAPSWTLPVVAKMPEVRHGILFPFAHGELSLAKRYAFAKTLRDKAYEQAIVLPGSFKSALTALFAKIPRRTGWLGEWRLGVLNDVRWPNNALYPAMVQRFAALGQDSKEKLPENLDAFYPRLIVTQEESSDISKKFQIDATKKILTICPGAEYGPAKRWPSEFFAAVAKEVITNDWQVVILGSGKDSELAKEILKIEANCLDLTGKTSLTDAISLLSISTAAICNDSGLMHIAAALDISLIVPYGSSSPAFTPPLSKKVSILHLGLSCSPCFKRICPLQHFDCMKKIKPEMVLSQLNYRLAHDNNINR